MRKTKIITTIVQETCNYEMLKNIILAGTDVVRVNLSYANREFCDTLIDLIRNIEKE
ncbi:MAG: pyruvate kinase, partial [Bacilli bacterium]|nr:pyruvate kinase [Bacilli bacterium]